MSREAAHDKGRRYVVEARLHVSEVGLDRIRATCRGDGQVYRLGWDRVDRWHCDCPAATDGCAHLVALRLVTVVERVGAPSSRQAGGR